jgi:opacity protein-like surface antigen
MKLKIAAIIIIFTAQISLSQNVMLSVGAGLSFPMSETSFTNAFNMGFNVHGSVTYPLASVTALRGDIQFNSFPYDESDPSFSGKLTVTTIKADILFGKFSERNVVPYGVVGAGLYLLSSSVTNNNVVISSSTTEFGLGLGGGVSFGVSSTANIYIETQYNFIFNDGSAKGYLPLKAGVTFRL